MVIDLVRAERGNILVVQRVGRSHARGRNLALKQFEFYIARDILLRAVHECGQRFAERGVPLAVVNKVGEWSTILVDGHEYEINPTGYQAVLYLTIVLYVISLLASLFLVTSTSKKKA